MRHFPESALIMFISALLVLAGCGGDKPPTVTSDGAEAGGTVLPVNPQSFHIILEAEEVAGVSPPAYIANETEVSKGKCIRIPLRDKGKEPEVPVVEFKIDVTVPVGRKVHFWFRTYWTGSCSNSILLRVPGLPEQIVGEDGTYNHWHWVKGPSLKLPQGKQTITIKQREDDIGLDQIIVTSNAAFVPVDIEEEL